MSNEENEKDESSKGPLAAGLGGGMIIGAVVGGPIGMLIGAALGGAIGQGLSNINKKSDDEKDE